LARQVRKDKKDERDEKIVRRGEKVSKFERACRIRRAKI